ncbi:MAG: dihydrolipoyl dehydrogenase [Bacteroidia bacterium]|nr:dihydrolipoyl dehydrogenase [Bacteroidia bacterium]
MIIGSGPGGYVAAIRASQLGLKVAVVEKENLGGICLNWGCIPTKSLLKSAQAYEYAKHASDYGVSISGEVKADFAAMVKRSRDVASGMSNGIQFLFKKNKVETLSGIGKLSGKNSVEVTDEAGKKTTYTAKHIILATGARSRELPNLPQDGKKIIGYRKALTLDKQPASMVVVGSGAIGSEFAYFYHSIGTEVTLVEFMPTLVPNEDEEVAKQLERSFKKMKMKVLTSSSVEKVDTSGDKCKVTIKTKKGEEVVVADIVLSAVGIAPNTEGIGLEELGVQTENGRVKVDEFYRTNIDGVYAIGDIIAGPALAHVASAEGIVCVEKIAGLNPEPINYGNIPGCTYTNPEISSVGLTEAKAAAIVRRGNQREITENGLTGFRRDTTTVSLLQALYENKFTPQQIENLKYIPFSEQVVFEMELNNSYVSSNGISIPLCEIRAPYRTFLFDVNRQETLNLIDLQEKLEKYAGLKVGAVNEPNNFAGNWE